MVSYHKKRQPTSWFPAYAHDIYRPEIARLQFTHGMQGIGLWHCIRCFLLVAEDNELPMDYDLIAYQCREKNIDLIKSVILDFGLFESDETKGVFFDPDIKSAAETLQNARDTGSRGGKGNGKNTDSPNLPPQKEEANTLQGVNANTLQGVNANTLQGVNGVPLQPIDKIRIDKNTIDKKRDDDKTDISQSSSSSSPSLVDFDSVVSAWNGLGLKAVAVVTDEMRTNIAERRRDLANMKMTFTDFFARITKSEYLTGKAEKKFVASLGWAMKKPTFDKIMGGDYDTYDKTPKARDAPGKPSMRTPTVDDYEKSSWNQRS